jgi:hypothetical protein
MTVSTAVLQLHHREAFEGTATRALAAGALAGLLHLALGASPGLPLPPGVPLLAPALAAVALAALLPLAASGPRAPLVGLLALALLAAALPLPPLARALGLAPGWAAALGGAGAGLLLVRARARVTGGAAGELPGAPRTRGLHQAVGAGLGAALAPLGALLVVPPLAARLEALATPPPLLAAASGAALALLLVLPALAAHLALVPDPVEARGAALLPTLPGELHALTARALARYRQCGATLAALPPAPGHAELAQALGRLTGEALELASAWAGVEAQLGTGAREGLSTERRALGARAAGEADALARAQLLVAAEALREEEERLAELEVGRARTHARLHALAAHLDRARVALVGLRGARAEVHAAQLSALARRVHGLASAPLEEGRLGAQAAALAEAAQVAAHGEEAALARRVREGGGG